MARQNVDGFDFRRVDTNKHKENGNQSKNKTKAYGTHPDPGTKRFMESDAGSTRSEMQDGAPQRKTDELHTAPCL